MGEPALDGAIVVEDQEKFSSLPGQSIPIEIHYRITTPFQVSKDMHEDDDDVKIRGPVYVGNDEMLDRHGELVEPKAILDAWESYSMNPVILYNHSKSYGVIGRMDGVEMGDWEGIGDVVIGNAVIDGGEKDITRKIKKGMLKAFSIGFIAKAAVKECEDEDSCYLRFTEIDWIETSVVDIPASPNALFNVEKTVSYAHTHEKNPCECGGGCCSGEKEVVIKDINLNRAGEEVAAKCIVAGDTILDGSWEPPSAEAENAYQEEHGWEAYGMWFLGRRADAEPETKQYYAYPWSPNFKDCSRPGLNAIRSRAGQNGDEGVFRAAGRLRELMDDRKEGIEFVKEEVGTDIYTTSEEAETRAQELGCDGSHSMEGPDGELLYMPCKNHDDYEGTLENPDLPMKNIQADSKLNLSDSVMNPLATPFDSMASEITATVEDEDTPIEVKEVEIPVVEEEVQEVVIEEVTEEESIAEVPVVQKELTSDEVLVEVVSVLKSVNDRIASLETILDTTTNLETEVSELKSLLAEVAEAKTQAEAEAAIEAEVAKRVAEILTTTKGSTSVAARKTLTTVPVDLQAKNTFDPSPQVSPGMNGLATWLEDQISSR